MGAGKMHRVNKSGQTSSNYNGGHTGKGKKGVSKKRELKSVYAAGTYDVLKSFPKANCGYRGPRVRNSVVMNPS